MDNWQILKTAYDLGWRDERPAEPLVDTVAAAKKFIADKHNDLKTMTHVLQSAARCETMKMYPQPRS